MTCSTSSSRSISTLASTGRRAAARWARTLAALALLVTLAPTRAHADDAAERKAVAVRVLMQHVATLASAKKGFFAHFAADASACRKAIQDGTAAGMKPLDTFDTLDAVMGELAWQNAGRICDEYARLLPMRSAVAAVAPLLIRVQTIYANGEGHRGMRGDVYRQYAEGARACVAAVDQAIKDGAPSDVGFTPRENINEALLTLVEARKQCSDFIAWGKDAGAAVDTEEKAAEAALREKYAKHGITGDRLKYLMESDNRYVRGKGCKVLDLAGKKKAAVFFEMSEGDTYWVVYKMTYKGDRLVKTTERRFSKLTSNGWSCK
jgi:hypothetical protein